MGWNRLSQSNRPDEENSEQDVAIFAWYEILLDAGVPSERWNDCYRSAQARKSEMIREGKQREIVAPNDLCVEWLKIRDLHQELDNTRLLTENASGTCLRCFGTGKEEMLDGTVKPGCEHLPISEEEERERKAAAILRGAEIMKEAMKHVGNPKPVERKPEDKGPVLQCSDCGRKQSSWLGWREGDPCNVLFDGVSLDGSPVTCTGKFSVH